MRGGGVPLVTHSFTKRADFPKFRAVAVDSRLFRKYKTGFSMETIRYR